MHGAAERPELALMQDLALELAVIPQGAVVETAGDPGVGESAPALHRGREVGVTRNPIVDDARTDAEELGQFIVGRAEQAVIVRLLAKLRTVTGGTAHGAHRRIITPIVIKDN
jgi:hypothetical protein